MSRGVKVLGNFSKNVIWGIAVIIILISLSSQVTSRSVSESNFCVDFGTDLVNRYVWRGQSLCNTSSIQPYTELSFKNLVLSSWLSYFFGLQELQEEDQYLSFSTSFFTYTLNYYFTSTETYDVQYYYYLGKNTTPHVLEKKVDIVDIPNIPITTSSSFNIDS